MIISDNYIHNIFIDEMRGDNSFKENHTWLSLLFGGQKYSNAEMKETWNDGIKHGIEIGLRRASLEGQRIELTADIKDDRHKEFIKKFYQLAEEYRCAIQWHPSQGMIIIDRTQ